MGRLAASVWLHTTWRRLDSGVRFPSHGLVVADGDGVMLVDTAWGAEPTRELLAWVDSELGLPVTRAVVTHFHDDRLGGRAVLAERSIPVFAHPLTARLAPAEDRAGLRALEVLASTGATVDLGPVTVFYPGPAHTRDNLMVWIEGARLLFGGCAVRPAERSSLGNTVDADLAAWPDAIRAAVDRFPGAETVVPSHGEPGGRDLLDHTLRLLLDAGDAGG